MCRYFTVVHHHDTVGQLENFIQVRGNEKDSLSLVPGLLEKIMYQFFRADIDSPGGLSGDEDIRIRRKLPGHHHLLDVSPREAAHIGLGALGENVKPFDQILSVGSDAGPVEPSPPGKPFLVVSVDDEILFHRRGIGHPVFHPVFGDMGQPRLPDLPGGQSHQAFTPQGDTARTGLNQTRDGGDQFGLAVSFHPGDTEDLSRSDIQGYTLEGFQALVIPVVKIPHREPYITHGLGGGDPLGTYIAAHHEVGNFFFS